MQHFISFIVGCRGVVQLGGLDPCYNRGVPAKVGACKPFQITESSHVVITLCNVSQFELGSVQTQHKCSLGEIVFLHPYFILFVPTCHW